MDFEELCSDSFQGLFDKTPAKLDGSFSLDADFGFTPSALSELPCDLGSDLQLQIPEPFRRTTTADSSEEQTESSELCFSSTITNPFDGLELSGVAVGKPSLAASLTAQASFGEHFLQDTLDSDSSSTSGTGSIALKLTKSARFQPYDSGKDCSKKVERVADSYKQSGEYRIRREKNNEAVRKSRAKAKLKSMETEETVQQLKQENTDLKRSLDDLQNQLDTLKTLLTAQAE